MRGITHWQFKPYRPFHKSAEAQKPFICRLAPGAGSVELEWFDAGSLDEHFLVWRDKGSSQPWHSEPAVSGNMILSGLVKNKNYELAVVRKNEPDAMSAVRYARTGDVPGQIVNYLHPEDEIYAFSGRALCSPSLVKLPSGALLASMDLFAPGAPQNLTVLCRSDDRGQTWRYVTDLFPCYWGTLFINRNRLYMQGCSTEYGDVLIGASDDEGSTWTKPSHLFVGSSSQLSPGWQRAPMPIIKHQGRLFVSADYGAWKEGGHGISVLSAYEDEDLLEARNWTCSEPVAYDPSWPGAPTGPSSGLLEGNMVVGKDGRLLDVLRIGLVNCEPNQGVAAVLEADPDQVEKKMQFHRFIKMPSGSNSKSYILYDAVTGKYVAIGNICVNPETPGQRNVLALQCSDNLYDWKIGSILLDYRNDNPQETGFQYISFIIDGDDLLYLSRTALNQARNYHDANYITFHIIENFRKLL